MGAFDIIRNVFRSPADRRLYEAERAAEAWSSAPAPSPTLAGAAAGAPVRTPGIDWTQDQPTPHVGRFTYQPGYSGHVYEQFSAPVSFDGFGLERIAATKTAHRLGSFYESSAMMIAALAFAPVLAALGQAIAPIIALPQHVHGGDRGLAKLVAAEIEEMLVPRGGLLPSPFFPPTLRATTAIYLRMMGFAMWQHIDGDMDPETGIRQRYTRIWEPWACQRTRSPRKVIVYTTEGAVEVTGDGKFSLLESTSEGYLYDAAILALGDDAAAGKLTQQARLKWLDFFSSQKLVAMLPQHVPTQGQAGDAFAAALDTIWGPDGRGVLPYGAKVEAIDIKGDGAGQFDNSALASIIQIFMVLTGSAGTIGPGGPTGAGPYVAKDGGIWTVAHHLVAKPTITMDRAANAGISAPYCDINYGDQIEAAKRAGTWKYPILSTPIPAPDRDKRIEALVAREKAREDRIERRRALGIVVTQDDADDIADDLEVRKVTLAEPGKGTITTDDMELKLFTPDEYRAQQGYDAFPGGMGGPEHLAEERAPVSSPPAALAKVAPAEGAAPLNDEERGPGTKRSGPQEARP